MTTLGDLVTLQRGTTYKSALLGQPGPVLLGLASIARNGGFRSDALRTYGGDSAEKLLVRPGELYVSLKDVTQSADLLGSVARVPLVGPVGRLTQDTVRLDIVSDDIDRDYLYLALLAPDYRTYCRAHATGTTNLGLPREDFLAYDIPLPPLAEQRRIAEVIGALDDLIDHNRRLRSDLQSLAQTMFDHSAIEGEPTTFGNVARLVRENVSVQQLTAGTPYLGLEHFSTDGYGISGLGDVASLDSNKSRFEAGDVLYGKLRPYFRKHDRPGFSGVCSTEIWVLRPMEGFAAATVDALVSRPDFTEFAMSGSGGTRMPRADWKHVSTMPVRVPRSELRSTVEAKLDELWRARAALAAEIDDLTKAREELLPMLVAGRVSVSDIEGAVASWSG